MRRTSIKLAVCAAWLVLALLFSMKVRAAPLMVQIDGAASITLEVVAGQPSAQLAQLHKAPLLIDGKLKHSLRQASEFFVVGGRGFNSEGRTFMYIVTESPSSRGRSTGYCGAGTEDRLHLVELQPKQRRLVQRDTLLLQSCLSNLALSDDSGASLRKRLESLIDPARISLQWLAHPKFADSMRTMHTVNAKLKVD